MATDIQIKQWRTELLNDYKSCDPYFIDLVLSLYKNDAEYVKKFSKKKFKKVEYEVPSEIVGGVSIIDASDTEKINH
jgi:hypothetical protein